MVRDSTLDGISNGYTNRAQHFIENHADVGKTGTDFELTSLLRASQSCYMGQRAIKSGADVVKSTQSVA